MSEQPNNPPAFPNTGDSWSLEPTPGMTLRDWFAGQALCSLRRHHSGSEEWFAAEAYRQADAMLAARVDAMRKEERL